MDERLPSCCVTEHMGHGSKIKIGKAIKQNVRVQVEESSSSSLTYKATYTCHITSMLQLESRVSGTPALRVLAYKSGQLDWKLSSPVTDTISTEIIAEVILVPYRLLLEWHGNLTLKMQSIRFYTQYNYLRAFSYMCFP